MFKPNQTAEIEALKRVLADALETSKTLMERDTREFLEVYAMVVLAERKLKVAEERHNHKIANPHKMNVLDDLQLQRRRY